MPARENFFNFLKKKPAVYDCGFSSFIKIASFFNAQSCNFYDFHAVPVRENFLNFQGDPHDLASGRAPSSERRISEHESAYCNTIELLNNNS